MVRNLTAGYLQSQPLGRRYFVHRKVYRQYIDLSWKPFKKGDILLSLMSHEYITSNVQLSSKKKMAGWIKSYEPHCSLRRTNQTLVFFECMHTIWNGILPPKNFVKKLLSCKTHVGVVSPKMLQQCCVQVLRISKLKNPQLSEKTCQPTGENHPPIVLWLKWQMFHPSTC